VNLRVESVRRASDDRCAQDFECLDDGAPPPLQRARPLLGTLVSIRIDRIEGDAETAFRAAFAAIEAVHAAMSFHAHGSELDRLNREGHRRPQQVGCDTWRVLRASLALARASVGRFDPTIAGRLVRDGFLPAHPGHKVAPDADWRDVVPGPGRTVFFRKPLLLDFGGIAKGYAVDRAIHALRVAGVQAAAVNAGGDLRVFGAQEQIIQVRDPGSPTRPRPLLALREGAVATSAGYFSARNGRTPLVDPLREVTLGHDVSVSVCAPRAIWADALTKIVLADEAIAVGLLRRLRASAMVFGVDGRCRQIGA
jgi:thiamine biosynthesis lipoprotein